MKFTILTLLICLTANAQLPDEINYSPYEARLNTITDQLDDSNYYLGLKQESLRDKLQAISYTQNLIAEIGQQISSDSIRLNKLKKSLPILKREIQDLEYHISNVGNRIRSNEQKLANLRSKVQRTESEIRPVEQKISRERSSLERIKSAKRSSLSKKSKLVSLLGSKRSKLSKNKNLINKNKNTISGLKSKLASLKSNLSIVNTKISSLNNELAATKSNESKLKSSLSSVKGSLSSAKSNLRSLQSSGASSSAIQNAKSKVRSLESKVSALNSKLSALRSKVRSISSKRSASINQKKKIESNLRSIPSKITKLQNSVSSAARSNQFLKVEVSKLSSKIQSEDKIISDLSNKEKKHKSNISRLSDRIAPLRNKIKDLKEKRSLVASTNNQDLRKRKDLRAKLNRTTQLRNNNKQEVPVVSRSISRSRQNRATMQNKLISLQSEERLIRVEISESHNTIRDLEYDQSQAKYEFEQRLSLFNHYENEASDIGSSQNTNGEELGVDAGAEYSKELVQQNAKSLSFEIGTHKARLIGAVRGEIDGYAIGYEKGFNSEDSISEGVEDGIESGKANALQYAQNTLRPNFFESFLSELLSKNITNEESNITFNSSKSLEYAIQSLNVEGDIPSITQAEYEKSSMLKTSLDSSIAALIQSDFQLDTKLNSFKTAGFVFNDIATVPYQQINCSSVYKGISIYKSKCEQSYKRSFSASFKNKLKETFFSNYPSHFLSLYSNLVEVKLNELLEGFYVVAKETSLLEAVVIGKKDVYNKYYEESYQSSYSSQLPIETNIASSQAKQDVDTWIISNPVVTVKSVSISLPVLKGGDNAELLIELKNVSNVDSVNTGILSLVGLDKVTFSDTSFKLVDVKARSVAIMKIPFTVDRLASSFESVVIGTEFTLKGDKYKSSRFESLSLNKKLSKNAKFNIDYKFNTTPKVKGFRKYYVHSFDFDITSTVENISEGYDVELIPLDGAEKYLSFKKNNLNSQATTANIQSTTSVTYVFKKSAKKRKLSFKAIVSYRGLVMSEKNIEMIPR